MLWNNAKFALVRDMPGLEGQNYSFEVCALILFGSYRREVYVVHVLTAQADGDPPSGRDIARVHRRVWSGAEYA